MTRKDAIRINHQESVLLSLGFTPDEAEALRRISLTLSRWSEHECNGAIQRDGDNGDGAPYWYNTNTGRKMYRAPDRERGAMKRLTAIVAARNVRAAEPVDDTEDCFLQRQEKRAVTAYIQGDPRGCSLYILRPGDVPDGQRADSYYSRGIAVY